MYHLNRSVLNVLLFLAAWGILVLLAACDTIVPEDDGTYRRIYHIDPDSGSDANDGLSEAKPFKTLAALDGLYPVPDSLVAFKRGAVHRLGKTILLKGGTSEGFVTYGAYGDVNLPKPILAGSVAFSWNTPGTNTAETGPAWSHRGGALWELDWSLYIDTGDNRSEYGPEQGPGNLWFFDSAASDAAMIGWGWRRQDESSLGQKGDWFYDASTKTIVLYWDATTAPVLTEASPNRTALSFAGQDFVILRDLDIRYCGGYAIRGHEANYLRVLDTDISFCGGGTKNGEYVRLGNGIECNGNTRGLLVDGCRMYQIYDTGFDPQNTGTMGVTQKDLTFSNNVVSHAGLAGCELWLRPAGSALEDVSIQGNTFANNGRGWGYEQHDHRGQAKVGGDVVIFQNDASAKDISITGNVFANSRVMLMAEWRDGQSATQALVRALTMDRNTWYPGSPANPCAILFAGTLDEEGTASLGNSTVYDTLEAWQASKVVTGKDASSTQGSGMPAGSIADPATQDSAWIFSATTTKRPTRFGDFGP